jgi:hypothetical protein
MKPKYKSLVAIQCMEDMRKIANDHMLAFRSKFPDATPEQHIMMFMHHHQMIENAWERSAQIERDFLSQAAEIMRSF